MPSLREAAATLNNTGVLLHNRGRYDEAFQNYRDAISIRASMLRGLRIGGGGGVDRQQALGNAVLQSPVVTSGSGTTSTATASTSLPAPVVEHETAQRADDATELYRRLLDEQQQLQNHDEVMTRACTDDYAAGTTGTTAAGSSGAAGPPSHPSREHGASLDFLSISRHGIERRGDNDEDHAATSRRNLLCPSRPIALYVNEDFARREEEIASIGGSNRRNNGGNTARPTSSPSSSLSPSSSMNPGTTTAAPSTGRTSHAYDSYTNDDEYDEYLDSGVTLFNMGLVFSQHPASGNLESAQRLMSMALSVIPLSSSSIYAMVLACEAYVHYRAGSLENATNCLIQALPILSSGIDQTGSGGDSGSASRRPCIPTREVSVAIFSLLLRIHYEKGDNSAALENGNVLMHFVKTAFGEDSVQTAIVHYNLSLVLFAGGKIDQTFEHGNRFLDLIFDREHPPGRPLTMMLASRDSAGINPTLSPDVCRIFSNQYLRKQMAAAIHTLGRLHVETTSVQKGLLLLEQALALRTTWLSGDDQDIEESHICVGRIKSDLGIYPSAIFHFKQALEAIDAYVAGHNGGESSISTTADICGLKTLIAQSYYSHGDLEESFQAYEDVLEMLYDSNIGNRAELLSNILSMRGNIQMEMGEVTQAMESFVEAARESASSFDPSDELPLVLPNLFQTYGVQFHSAAPAA